jgi:hypothetical protein
VYDDVCGDLPPLDRGRLHAHRISAGPTEIIERCLNKARRQRHGFFSWFLLPGRRRYLDGLIDGLEQGLEHRYRDHGRPVPKRGEPNRHGGTKRKS